MRNNTSCFIYYQPRGLNICAVSSGDKSDNSKYVASCLRNICLHSMASESGPKSRLLTPGCRSPHPINWCSKQLH